MFLLEPKPFDDISFNYLIGQDGVVYEGRGHTQSAAALHWNANSISIGFLGTFTELVPNDDSVYVAKYFLQHLVNQGTYRSSSSTNINNFESKMVSKFMLTCSSGGAKMLYSLIWTSHITRFLVFHAQNVDGAMALTARSISQQVIRMSTAHAGMLSHNFTLHGLCQVRPFPEAPGCNFYKQIQTWRAWERGNTWSWVRTSTRSFSY